EIAAEVRGLHEDVQRRGGGVVWVETMLPRREVIPVLSQATVFVCPSVYEPFGLVNLEAMACETAVVASAVGGIPEIVIPGETGRLVDWSEADPQAFESDLADRIGELLADPGRAARMGEAGRRRGRERFSW